MLVPLRDEFATAIRGRKRKHDGAMAHREPDIDHNTALIAPSYSNKAINSTPNRALRAGATSRMVKVRKVWIRGTQSGQF
ncbi:hypothetical protein FRC12_022159 [Ceratobasidium sp. 428]|nr:hypothetical protein FRC12_022159 [Ceratobasidium sp. 428]